MRQLTKSRPGAARKPVRKGAGRYRVLGTTSDGIKILQPNVKPTHFTLSEIRRAIDQVRKSSSD